MSAIALRFEIPAEGGDPDRIGHLEAQRNGPVVQLVAVFYSTAPLDRLAEFSTFARTLANRVAVNDDSVVLARLPDGRTVVPVIQMPETVVPDHVPSEWTSR